MGLFKDLLYVSLGKKLIEFVDKEIDKFIPKKETVYIVYKEGKNENKESTKKEEPKEEKEVEKNNKWILERMMFNKTGIILFYFMGRKWIAVFY